ncbi:hypothetical protein PENARI_c017G10461 [Penicillium arizonense]|uniref:Uncharacterized protein n=1 Tax=Penicillium arizonense TaxID=1835702 RepID=A0A1F5LBL4_PENAI|nr:hypothetical protein PENARI_c017G10461 [Penicillium arizonense]OGE50329.1 hypothetical protein PENARI_c017G10461 [Penicillium arizonense]
MSTRETGWAAQMLRSPRQMHPARAREEEISRNGAEEAEGYFAELSLEVMQARAYLSLDSRLFLRQKRALDMSLLRMSRRLEQSTIEASCVAAARSDQPIVSDAAMDRGGNQQNASGDDPRYPEFDVGDTFDIGDEPKMSNLTNGGHLPPAPPPLPPPPPPSAHPATLAAVHGFAPAVAAEGIPRNPDLAELCTRVLQAQVDSCRAEADAAQAEANAAQARADLAFLEAELAVALPSAPFGDVDESTHAVDLTPDHNL